MADCVRVPTACLRADELKDKGAESFPPPELSGESPPSTPLSNKEPGTPREHATPEAAPVDSGGSKYAPPAPRIEGLRLRRLRTLFTPHAPTHSLTLCTRRVCLQSGGGRCA